MSILEIVSRPKKLAIALVCGSHTRRFIDFFRLRAANSWRPKPPHPSERKNEHSAKRVEIARSCRAIRSACFGRGCLRGCLRSLLSAVKMLLFALTLNVWALDITWIDSNTVQISGYGQGGEGEQPTVVTNFIGTCTNCVAISRGELDTLCDTIDSSVRTILQKQVEIHDLCFAVENECEEKVEEITGFSRFNYVSYSDSIGAFTNYCDSSPQNTQKSLTKSVNDAGATYPPQSAAGLRRFIMYSNGIYDYATQYSRPFLQSTYSKVQTIRQTAESVSDSLSAINGVNAQLRAVPICSNEPDYIAPSNGHSGCSWTVEQTEAVVQLLTDIKADSDRQLATLRGISNNVGAIESNIRSYGEFLRNTLSQGNGTIRLANNETPLDIYTAETAQQYDYNHSNILQRIELLLYNLSYSTNAPSDVIDEIDDATKDNPDEGDVQKAKDDSLDQISSGIDSSENKLNQVKQLWTNLLGLLQSLNGSINSIDLGEISWDDKSTVLGDGAIAQDDFKTTALNLLRLVFGVLYWLGAAAFIYYFYVRVLRVAVFVGKWASEIISTLFDDV